MKVEVAKPGKPAHLSHLCVSLYPGEQVRIGDALIEIKRVKGSRVYAFICCPRETPVHRGVTLHPCGPEIVREDAAAVGTVSRDGGPQD